MVVCLFSFYGDHRDLHVLTHSVPTRRSSDIEWNDIAVAIGRYAESSNDDIFFDFYNDDKPFPDTAQALGNLLGSEHGDAIMTALATWDSTGVAGSDGHAQQFGQNAIELGNLLRITAFNPDNPNADVAM